MGASSWTNPQKFSEPTYPDTVARKYMYNNLIRKMINNVQQHSLNLIKNIYFTPEENYSWMYSQIHYNDIYLQKNVTEES